MASQPSETRAELPQKRILADQLHPQKRPTPTGIPALMNSSVKLQLVDNASQPLNCGKNKIKLANM